MRRLVLVSLTAALAAPFTCSQDQPAPKPGEEMERLQYFVGHWKAQGTAVAPGFGEIAWTAKSESRAVLDGFFLEGRSDIDVELGAPMPLQFRTMMGWDAEHRRYVSFGVGSNGDHQGFETMQWVDDDTLIATNSFPKDGKPAVTRTIHRIESDDVWSLTVETAVGAGPFEVTVQGDYLRVDEAPTFAKQTAFIGSMVPNEMRKLKRMVGDWRTEGWFDFPGMGKLDVTGTEIFEYGFGGHVLTAVAHGHVGGLPPWTGWSFITWNARASAYEVVMFSNMGEVSTAQLVWDGDNPNQMIGISAMRYMGVPMASRSVTTFDDARIVGMTAHACSGAEAPKQNFEMSYSPRED